MNNTYSEDGFKFSTPDIAGQHFDGNEGYLWWHESGANFVNNLVKLDCAGIAFDFLSFDLLLVGWDIGINPVIFSMIVTASDGRSVTTVDGFGGTINANWTNVSWVTFDIISTDSWNMRMANVILDDTASVPEPSSFVLISLGLIGIGLRHKKRPGLSSNALNRANKSI